MATPEVLLPSHHYLYSPFSTPITAGPEIPRDPRLSDEDIIQHERLVIAGLAAQVDSLTAQVAQADAEKAALSAYHGKRVSRLKYDEMTGLITRTGLADELIEDDALREELLLPYRTLLDDTGPGERQPGLSWGMLGIDVRGVKAVNDLRGDHVGDAFICTAMRQISCSVRHLLRQGEERRHGERHVVDGHRSTDRRHHPDTHDKVIRWGGDEVTIIARHVSAYGLDKLARRLASEFSIERAMAKYATYEQAVASGLPPEEWEAQELPIIAGIGSAFIGSALRSKVVAEAMSKGDLLTTSRLLYRRADREQKAIKNEQYRYMWGSYVDGLDRDTREIVAKPSDDRKIIELFWKTHMPLFYEDIETYISNVRRSHTAVRPAKTSDN